MEMLEHLPETNHMALQDEKRGVIGGDQKAT